MNRGSWRSRGLRAAIAPSFNEAPIHESGKSRTDRLRPRTTPPSMRPRFMNRGSDFVVIDRWFPSSTFNEAPIHESGKFSATHERKPYVVPSMRPRFMNRGSPLATLAAQAARRPSMRPRFMNRGSHSGAVRGDRLLYASMRPRFMNRGSRKEHRLNGHEDPTLQ